MHKCECQQCKEIRSRRIQEALCAVLILTTTFVAVISFATSLAETM